MADRAPDAASTLLCLGVIGAAHGVRGAMKVKTFTQMPQDLAAYGPLTDEKGERAFIVTSCQAAKGGARITIKGVNDRNAAEALRNTRVYVARHRLPELDAADDFYHSDLIGLDVQDAGDAVLGKIIACHNFGAGDLIEVRFLKAQGGGNAFFPFTKEVVPHVDIAKGYVTLVPPKEDEARPEGQLAPSDRQEDRLEDRQEDSNEGER